MVKSQIDGPSGHCWFLSSSEKEMIDCSIGRVRPRTSPTSGDCRGADYLRVMKGEPGGAVMLMLMLMLMLIMCLF